MVGVLAMAAPPPPVKDYEIEPCKKRRKDEDKSSCTTITKYLSPIEKPGDRVFSPPKSSNILDYFRRTSPMIEKTQSAKEGKIKSQASPPVDSSKDCEKPLGVFSNVDLKKGKRINLSYQLNNTATENESAVEITADNKKDFNLNNDVGNCTSVLLCKKHAEVLAESIQGSKKQSNTMTSEKNPREINTKQRTRKNDYKRLRKRKISDVIDLTESVHLAEEPKLLKKDGKDSKQIMPSLIDELVSAAKDANSREHVTETVHLNDSIITVSYEEFLKSHNENKVEQIPGSTVSICIPSESVEEMVKSDYVSESENCEISQQACFKTVTVLAQVHPIPPKKAGKIPPIFLKQKHFELESSLSDPENEQTTQKRKSNVVIQEEELELAVLEAGSSEAVKPKCTLEERQQFMKAFRQPASDILKNGVKKSLDKQKDHTEKSLHEEGRDNSSEEIMETPNTQMVSSDGNLQSHTNKESFSKEKSKKLKKKGKKMLDMGATPGENREENTRKKQTTLSLKDKRNQNRFTMSLRQKKSEVFKSRLLNSESLCEDTANDEPLKISSLDRKKPTRKTSMTAKDDKAMHSKAETEGRWINASTKSTRRSLRNSGTSAALTMKGTDSEDAQNGSPARASTPTAVSMSEKHSLYTAELITISSDSESPIRIKFTRISTPKKSKKKFKKRFKKSETTDGDFTSQTRKTSNTSKNVSKAKQLIEKAKALHMSRSKATKEIVTPLRRSSRHQTLREREKLSETDDSVIIDSSPTSLKNSANNQKKLQCLSDVLGKKIDESPKTIPGKVKVAPLFLARKAQKTADPILDFDENSHDTTEKSQDCDVQFKAKRDFLMSGLPDLLKRQIAKKAAALDVYNSVGSSFQRVVHVQQKDDDCWLWYLKPPSGPLLTKFKDLDTKVINLSKRVITLGEFSTLNSNLKSEPALMFMRTRNSFTKEVKNILLEEIKWSNPKFSLEKYYPVLLKKRIEHQVLSEYHGKQESLQLQPDVSQKETKRKRMEIENQRSKRKRPDECSVSPEKINGKPEEFHKRNNSSGKKLDISKGIFTKTSQKKQRTLSTTCKVKRRAVEHKDVLVMDDGRESAAERPLTPESGTEDMLWTEKYQPQNAGELIGNESAIKRLHSWLKEWKRRAELEERQNLKGKRDEKQEDLLDSIDFKGSFDDEESRLCNTVLITGPTGVGKTAAVYACAQELGFKIFEVNASSQRSGRQILSQLKEATQSHQVDKQGVSAQKPCFFNSYNIGKSPKKFNSPKKVVTSPRKLPPSSPKSSGQKRVLATKTLANYFKVSSKPPNNEEIGALMENDKEIKSSLEQKQIAQTKSAHAVNSYVREFGAEELSRKNATCLILFEEVDVIFEEDAGFLNAIKIFMATTKRPVILTTSDPTFSLMFDGCFEEINFSTPSLLNVASYLQMICLTENFRTDVKDFVTLLTANACDIRRSILYLQFWIRSGGGILEERPLSCSRGNSTSIELVCCEDGPDSKNNTKNTKNWIDLPKCDIGCVESFFGLKNIFSPSEDLFSFLKRKISTKDGWHQLTQLLTEFHVQNVDFLYSNLEFILPLPVTIIPETKSACGSPVTVDTDAASRNMKCSARKHSEEVQPFKKSQKKKHKKKMIVLDDSDLFDPGLDFPDELLCLSPASSLGLEESKAEDKECKEVQSPSKPDTESTPCPPKTPAERKSSVLVSHCLNSLTEFMDNMSFFDALFTDIREQKEFSNSDFCWTTGKVKSGLWDEFSLESRDSWTSQSSGELKATAQALSFSKCSSTISKALETSLNSCKKLGRDPTNDLTVYVSQKYNVSFQQSAANLDNAWKRVAVIKSVFSSRSLLNLGNRQASVIEYLPTLRNICRTEKLKEQGKSKRRFLHYFEGIHLDIPKETVNTLAADFP